MSLYGWVILATIAGPLALSFDKKVAFYRHWKHLFIATLIVAVLFLCWDEYFTIKGVWGFNPDYLLGLYIGHLPMEEVSFFLVVPYACMFIYEVLKAYFPNFKKKSFAAIFAFYFAFSGLLFGGLNHNNFYTASACIITALLTIYFYYVDRKIWFEDFAFCYLIGMIPFLIVNGILTGAVTNEAIVWYSESHIMGPRIITIPVEDLYYNYALLLPIVAIYEVLKTKRALKLNQ